MRPPGRSASGGEGAEVGGRATDGQGAGEAARPLPPSRPPPSPADRSVRGGGRDPDRSVHSVRSAASLGHRSDSYHMTPGPDGSLRGGMAFRVEEGAPDALAGAPCVARVRAYFRKMGGGLDAALPVPNAFDAFVSTVGAFLGILAVAGIDALIRGARPNSELEFSMLVASFGATAVLIFSVVESKLSQVRNVIGGHVISAVVGCTVRLVLGARVLWLTSAVGMSLALLAMELTSTVHPPGGATALIGASARRLGPWKGYQLVATVAAGSSVMVLVAMAVNNLHPRSRYPTFYWGAPFPPAWAVRSRERVRRRRAASAAQREEGKVAAPGGGGGGGDGVGV